MLEVWWAGIYVKPELIALKAELISDKAELIGTKGKGLHYRTDAGKT